MAPDLGTLVEIEKKIIREKRKEKTLIDQGNQSVEGDEKFPCWVWEQNRIDEKRRSCRFLHFSIFGGSRT